MSVPNISTNIMPTSRYVIFINSDKNAYSLRTYRDIGECVGMFGDSWSYAFFVRSYSFALFILEE